MTLHAHDFDYVRRVLRDRAAITLDEGKGYLAEARLDALARREALGSIADLVARARAGDATLVDKMVEAMTTNETSFFRDLHPFEGLRTRLIPQLMAARKATRRLRVWSAACSSGQEAYSLAMLLREHFPETVDWDVSVLATDLSAEMVRRAGEGRYSQLEVNRGLPAALLLKYLRRDGLEWVVADDVRRMVTARRLNLAGDWPLPEAFDLILMRNVLIYFDDATKRKVLGRAARALRSDGYLLLGGAETTLYLDDSFDRIDLGRCGAYTLRPPRGAFA